MLPFMKARKVFENGLLDASEEDREVVAVYRTGEIYYAAGKKFNPLVRKAQDHLRSKFDVEPMLHQCSVEDLAARYREAEEQDIGVLTESFERHADKMLRDAAAAKTADIKIIRTPERTTIRFLIAGQELSYQGLSLSSLEGNALISYIFDSRDEGSGHSTKEKGEFQGFSVSGNTAQGGKLSLPANVLKLRCQKGFHETSEDIMDHVAIRIFYRESDDMASLEDLGLDPEVLDALQRAREGMKGATIIGGETGDGKSTTLISTIKQQYRENEGNISVVTVEDPVEYKLNEPGVIQIPLQSAGGAEERTKNYRAALMHFVRINPHVGMISEMRDAEAARQVLQFIETGHQVWTTIHINSVNSIPFRLIDMGIEPTELSKPDSLKLMLKQALVPLLCRCAIKGDDGYMHRNTEGCSICNGGGKGEAAAKAWAGFARLVAIAEFIEPDDGYLERIRANDALGAKNYWEKPTADGGMGGITLKQKLHYLAHLGAIDPKNALKKGAPIPKVRTEGLEIGASYRGWIQGLLDNRKTA